MTVPVYCSVSVIMSAGIAPATGTATPGISFIVIARNSSVSGNTAVITPEFAALLTLLTLGGPKGNVKKSAGTYKRVNPSLGVSVMVAV